MTQRVVVFFFFLGKVSVPFMKVSLIAALPLIMKINL